MKTTKTLFLATAVMCCIQLQAQQVDTLKHTRNTLEYRITPPDKTITVTERTVERRGDDSVVTITSHDSIIHPSDTIFRERKSIYSYVFSLGLGTYNSASMVDAMGATVLEGGKNLGWVLNTEFNTLYPVSDKWDLGLSLGLQGLLSPGELEESSIIHFPNYDSLELKAVNHYSDWRLGFTIDFVARWNITQRTSLVMGIAPKLGFMPYHGYLLYSVNDNTNRRVDYDNLALFLDARGFIEMGYTILQGVNMFLRVGYSHPLLTLKENISYHFWDLNVYGKSAGHELIFLFGYRGDILSIEKTKRYKTPNSPIKERVERTF